jgi:hypothetical protein
MAKAAGPALLLDAGEKQRREGEAVFTGSTLIS